MMLLLVASGESGEEGTLEEGQVTQTGAHFLERTLKIAPGKQAGLCQRNRSWAGDGGPQFSHGVAKWKLGWLWDSPLH